MFPISPIPTAACTYNASPTPCILSMHTYSIRALFPGPSLCRVCILSILPESNFWRAYSAAIYASFKLKSQAQVKPRAVKLIPRFSDEAPGSKIKIWALVLISLADRLSPGLLNKPPNLQMKAWAAKLTLQAHGASCYICLSQIKAPGSN